MEQEKKAKEEILGGINIYRTGHVVVCVSGDRVGGVQDTVS